MVNKDYEIPENIYVHIIAKPRLIGFMRDDQKKEYSIKVYKESKSMAEGEAVHIIKIGEFNILEEPADKFLTNIKKGIEKLLSER